MREMKDNQKCIFLTAPAGMFAGIEEAKKCARALQAMLKYHLTNKNIYEKNSVLIGVSNVNRKIAHYETMKKGIGRPQRTLIGDVEKCFVDPHLHILIDGKNAEYVSTMIINYLIKKSKIGLTDVGKLVWKEYIETDLEEIIVEDYIEKQSFSLLTVNRFNASEQIGERNIDFNETANNDIVSKRYDLFEYLDKLEDDTNNGFIKSCECCSHTEEEMSVIDKDIAIKENNEESIKHSSFENTYEIDTEFAIADLRCKWICLQELKRIAIDIVDFESADTIVNLQLAILNFANALKSNIYVNYYEKIKNITLQSELLRKIILSEKKSLELTLKLQNESLRYDYS